MNKSMPEIQIKDIMTTNIIAAEANDNVLDVAKVMTEKDFNGIPVIDKFHKLIGMVTMRELLDKKGFYLPTAIKLLGHLRTVHGEDIPEVEKKLKALKNLKVSQVMNRQPPYLIPNATLEQTAETFIIKHEDILPVVDETKTLVGVLTKYDILKALSSTFFAPFPIHPEMTIEDKSEKIIEEVEKKYVVISKTRLKFWYVGFLVFLILGMAVATFFIIRINLR